MSHYNHDLHHRRSIRLTDYDYRQTGAYFVTICAANKQCLFGEIANDEMQLTQMGETAIDCWEAIPQHFPNTELDAFVLMPNHLHGIVVIQTARAQHAAPLHTPPHVASGSLGAIIRSFKSATTRQINILRKKPGETLWQRNYYEHVIRNEADLDRIRHYIEINPSKWSEDTENPISYH